MSAFRKHRKLPSAYGDCSRRVSECLLMANFVEQLGVAAALGIGLSTGCRLLWPLRLERGAPASCSLSGDGWTEREHRQLAKVLGGCRQGKFVMRACGTAQSESIELQDAFQMSEQHLDLFPVAT